MNLVDLTIATVLAFFIGNSQYRSSDHWAWLCDETIPDSGACQRVTKNSGDLDQQSFLACKLTCGTYGALWPRPRHSNLDKDIVLFLPQNIIIYNSEVPLGIRTLVDEALELALDSIIKYNPDYVPGDYTWPLTGHTYIDAHKVSLYLEVVTDTAILDLGTDESYSIKSYMGSSTLVTIEAKTFFGLRHGLETFTQLMDFDEENNALQVIQTYTIDDSPSYEYRGLLLDTSRNYIPIDDIKRTIDAMSYNKLNTLHWHMTDSQSYPLVVESLPNLSYYGAYSQREVYLSTDIEHIISYGNVRGVRIVPEFDAPAHVGNGWQWGKANGIGDLVSCFNEQPWSDYCSEPPCGQLNIANDEIYTILQTMYISWMGMFDPVFLFHFGGDEVNINCWNSSDEIRDWMTAKGNSLTEEAYIAEWSNFQEKARDLALIANGGRNFSSIVWTSKLTDPAHIETYLDKNDYIIQIWTSSEDSIIGSLLNKGYSVIFSNYDALYLTCGFGNTVTDGQNWCDPFKGWKDVYDNSLIEMSENTGQNFTVEQILGGEATFWSEQADENTLDQRLWPRGAALGERLWNDDPLWEWRNASFRLIHHRQRMVKRGIRADREMPDWCHQNAGECQL